MLSQLSYTPDFVILVFAIIDNFQGFDKGILPANADSCKFCLLSLKILQKQAGLIRRAVRSVAAHR